MKREKVDNTGFGIEGKTAIRVKEDRLSLVTNGSVQRMMRIAKRNGWDEVLYDCREELQRRATR